MNVCIAKFSFVDQVSLTWSGDSQRLTGGSLGTWSASLAEASKVEHQFGIVGGDLVRPQNSFRVSSSEGYRLTTEYISLVLGAIWTGPKVLSSTLLMRKTCCFPVSVAARQKVKLLAPNPTEDRVQRRSAFGLVREHKLLWYQRVLDITKKEPISGVDNLAIAFFSYKGFALTITGASWKGVPTTANVSPEHFFTA